MKYLSLAMLLSGLVISCSTREDDINIYSNDNTPAKILGFFHVAVHKQPASQGTNANSQAYYCTLNGGVKQALNSSDYVDAGELSLGGLTINATGLDGKRTYREQFNQERTAALLQYYGHELPFKLSNDQETIVSGSLKVPSVVEFTGAYDSNMPSNTPRTFKPTDIITWNADKNNPTGQVTLIATQTKFRASTSKRLVVPDTGNCSLVELLKDFSLSDELELEIYRSHSLTLKSNTQQDYQFMASSSDRLRGVLGH